MFKTLKQQQGIIIAAVIALAAIIAVGYISASLRSEPKYRSKVDEMMFEEGNKSPKYIITLPEHQIKKNLAEEVASLEKDNKDKKVDDGLTVQQRVLSNVPLLAKLEPIEALKPLKIIDPEPAMQEQVGDYLLPKENEGHKVWAVYGQKVRVLPNFYRVAVIFKNFGIDKLASEAVTKGMPSAVSFSFSPYAIDKEKQIKDARASGHETYMDLLLPSKNYLNTDPGPLAMDITASPEELVRRVRESLSVNAPLGGMLVSTGHAGVDSISHLEKVFNEISARGLLILNSSGEETLDLIKIDGLARNKADIVIDESFRPEDIRNKLAAAEIIARNKGLVIVVAEPKPVVVREVRKWLDSFSPQMSYEELRAQNIKSPERPFALVPLSNTVIE